MRILHVIHTPRYSGAEMLVASLAKNHAVMGHASCVVSINPFEEDFKLVIEQQKHSGIAWITPPASLGRLARAPFIKKAAADFRPNVTFSHSVIPAAYARLASIRNVISVLHSETNYESGYVRYFEKLLQYRLSGVISVSEPARQQYTDNFSYPPTILIPNGISISSIERGAIHRETTRESLGFTNADQVAVQIGRITAIKQQHLSLQAILPVIKGNATVHFLLAGLVEDAAYLDQLKHIARNEGVERNIHFLGSRKDVADLLCAADLFLMPSFREAHSVAIIEALAAGLPIIASPIPSFQYTSAFEGVCLLPPENVEEFSLTIKAILNHRQRYDRDLRGFDIEDTALAYIDFATQCTS